MPINECIGDLTRDDADVLVNTVNVGGPTGPVMGKGLAAAFARRWPSILPVYRAACASGELREGSCKLFELPEARDLFSGATPRHWAAFATKKDWRDPSRYPWIESGLSDLVAALGTAGFRSVAVPPLGCGNGGLSWLRVRPMIEAAFRDTGLDVRLYAPPRA